MKNRHKIYFCFLFWPLLIVAFFRLNLPCQAEEKIAVINELMWMGSSVSIADEWIELKNMTSASIDFSLNPWSIYKNGSLMLVINKGILEKNSYFLVSNNKKNYLFTGGESILNIDPDFINADVSLSNSSAQYKLYGAADNTGALLDIADDGTGNPPAGDNGTIKKSMERNDTFGDGANPDSWHACYSAINLDSTTTDCGTPKHENSKKLEEPKKEAKNYSGKIIINEIYPSPPTGEKEFIEIKNLSEENINLKGWSATDSIHEGKPLETETIIAPGGLYTFEGTFYLNTPGDTAKVLDENQTGVVLILYDNAKSNHSYAFDGSVWRWTRHITKGKDNEFDEILSGKIKKDKKIYAGIYADFEASADEKAKKFNWKFGDGHGSALRKTRHKYEKPGNYRASLKITGDGEDNLLNFEVNVEDYSTPEVKIVSLVPNPKGKDDAEYILIKNNSKDKINLLNWSIATGWKSLVNHPLRKDFIIKKGETKKLTKKICAFTLNNEKTKIELRYPNGEVAQKIKYNRKKNKIEEDEIFEISGKNEIWIKPQDTQEEKSSASKKDLLDKTEEKSDDNESAEENVPDTDIQIDQVELEASLGKYSSNPDWENKQKNRIGLANSSALIKPRIILADGIGRVLGTEKIRSEKNYYAFTNTKEEKHWAVKLIDDLWIKINSKLNRVLNRV